jgi:class 3 adenylate cyclase
MNPITAERLPRILVADDMHATPDARFVEALSEKLAPHLSPASWRLLFNGPDAKGVRFERKQQTLLFAESAGRDMLDDLDRDALAAEVEWLAMRHGGSVDRFHDGAGVACFDDPAACVRMAMELQRTASDLKLRIGVHTGICDIASFRSDHQSHCTLIGEETRMAAEVAATAAIGSIAVSPETYALVKDGIHADLSGCLVMEEFHDSDLAQVCLTPAPVKHTEHALSTFAGLGRH